MALSPRGPRNATPDTWRRCVALADEADLRLHTHVNENQAQADLLGASPEGRDLEALASWGALSPRLVMAHAVWLSDHERDLARRHRPHVCHCPSANLKLASGFAPVPGYLGRRPERRYRRRRRAVQQPPRRLRGDAPGRSDSQARGRAQGRARPHRVRHGHHGAAPELLVWSEKPVVSSQASGPI